MGKVRSAHKFSEFKYLALELHIPRVFACTCWSMLSPHAELVLSYRSSTFLAMRPWLTTWIASIPMPTSRTLDPAEKSICSYLNY